MTQLYTKFQALEAAVSDALVERNKEVRSAVLALIARKHMFLLGAPGTGKSLLIRTLTNNISGFGPGDLFVYLFSAYSTPEEVFGPMSLKGLEEDRFFRQVRGKLPVARMAVLEEVFKANSAILNSLLMIMNERVFVNDGEQATPLSTICAASNELPQGEELQAMYDRLLIRHVVQPISEPGAFLQMLQGKIARSQGTVTPTPVVSWVEVEAAQAEVQKVNLPMDVLEAVTSLQFALQKDGIHPTARRMAEGLELIQAAAWLRGADNAEIDDCRCLQHVLWDSPDERVPVAKHVLQLANPLDREALDLAENVAQLREEVKKTLTTTDKESQQRTEGLMMVNKRLKEAAQEFKSIQARANKAGRQSEILDQLRKEIKGINEQIGQEIFGKGLDD